MPPKVRITKEDIVSAALGLVREAGSDALNARELASRLACSTQPIFSNFATMEDLLSEVIRSAHGLYLDFLDKEARKGEYPTYKAFGMAYIRFASEERELFKLLFMCDREGKGIEPTQDFETSVDMIASANGISEEKARLLHTEMWVCVHGIATMHATSFLSLERELVSEMLTDIYQGLRLRHIGDEKN